jgi:hypothetical protein
MNTWHSSEDEAGPDAVLPELAKLMAVGITKFGCRNDRILSLGTITSMWSKTRP